MKQYEEFEYLKLKVMAALGDHVGEQNSLVAPALVEKVFGRTCDDPYNGADARRLRNVIDALQKEGKKICSRAKKEGAGTGSPLPPANIRTTSTGSRRRG